MRYHPILKTFRMHAGLDPGAVSGTRVVAAQSGTIAFSGWLGGYGYMVIINHGNGITSLYGHNSSLTVHAIQYVNQGQVISYSGSTGLATGPHLHFEIRQDGDPVNPLNWL
ncbi:MAG TPA: M23 family metallopeptidase [Candidatus Aquicultor sp.]|jgi:murein DD-endopeptidase MepM/ murein hydrolase activator NlpD